MGPAGRPEGAGAECCAEQRGPEPEEEWDELTPEEIRAGAGDFDLLPLLQPSFGKAVRALRQQERSRIANYILSIHEDSKFVAEARGHFPRMPLLANLRAGAWYAAPEALDGTCYFKSTDGHAGHWDFSSTRLNLHVASLAASRGGALLVDSTRRGKRFPDSFSKTVPIWCAVLSLAAEQHSAGARAQDSRKAGRHLHLPPWVEASERDQIEQRLPLWVERLAALLPAEAWREVAGGSGRPALPLRPFWICPGDDLPERFEEVAAAAGACLPVVCICASRHVEAAEHREWHSWSYIQGAGDDHENWAGHAGLTPELLWRHAEELLAAARSSPEAVEALAASLARAEAPSEGGGRAAQVLSWIGETGLAVGCFSAAAPPRVWEDFGAVLNVGSGEEHPGAAGDPRCCAIPVADGKRADPLKSWWQTHVLPPALRFVSSHLGQGRRVLVHCDRGDTRAPAVTAAVLAALFDEACRFRGAGEPGRPPLSKEGLRRAMVTVQRYHAYCAVPRRIMQQLNLFFVTSGGGWSTWKLEEDAQQSPRAPARARGAPAPEPDPDRWCMDEVWPRLFLGNARAAGSLPLLRQRGITHVVNVTAEPCPFPEDFQYCHVAIQDERGARLLPELDRAVGFIDAALAEAAACVLVHCREGVSRSVAVVLGYLLMRGGLSLHEALQLVRSRRPSSARTRPNAGFRAQLLELEASLGRTAAGGAGAASPAEGGAEAEEGCARSRQ